MKYALLLCLVACTTPQKPVADDLYTDVCKPVPPRRVPRKVGGYHIATQECRVAKYWTVVNNRWVAK